MKIKLKVIILFVALIALNNILSAQNFSDQFDAFLATSDFADIKGDLTSHNESIDADIYNSTIFLEGFDVSIIDRSGDNMVYGSASDIPLASLNLAMLQMLPPTGYTIVDSNSDASVELDDDQLRQVTYVKKDRHIIVNVIYFKDGEIGLTITKQ